MHSLATYRHSSFQFRHLFQHLTTHLRSHGHHQAEGIQGQGVSRVRCDIMKEGQCIGAHFSNCVSLLTLSQRCTKDEGEAVLSFQGYWEDEEKKAIQYCFTFPRTCRYASMMQSTRDSVPKEFPRPTRMSFTGGWCRSPGWRVIGAARGALLGQLFEVSRVKSSRADDALKPTSGNSTKADVRDSSALSLGSVMIHCLLPTNIDSSVSVTRTNPLLLCA